MDNGSHGVYATLGDSILQARYFEGGALYWAWINLNFTTGALEFSAPRNYDGAIPSLDSQGRLVVSDSDTTLSLDEMGRLILNTDGG